MALMASQSPEPALSDEKSVKPAPAVKKDEPNGTVELNGHASHADAISELTTPLAPTKQENGEMNGTAHEETEAPASDSKPDSEAQHNDAAGPPPTELADAQAEPKQTATDDTEMLDARAVSPAAEDKAQATPAPADEAKEISPIPEGAHKPGPPDAKPDVEMDDVSPTAAVPSSAERAASTQDTAVSDPPPATPAEDLSLHPASMSSLAIDTDAVPASPVQVATADTSMSDAPQSPVKVARGREEDEDEDGPAAKRVKTDPPSDVVEVKTGPEDATPVNRDNTTQVSLYNEDGRPKNLADPSLDGNEITKYQSNKLRGILAGIKKTKAGVNFKTSVQQMWPALWSDYRSKISEPTDIGTMEKRLKGAGEPEYPPYPNMGMFKRDLELLYTNSLKFNGEAHTITQQAKIVQEQVLERMASIPVVESKVEEKKAPKQHSTRHAEPRTASQPSPAQPARRPSKPAVPSPEDKPEQSPAFAIPPNNHGVPLIRRDSTKNADDRPKRPVHPPKSKDFGYDVKKTKKLPLELRFCREVLNDLMKARHQDVNGAFMRPVDPVAEKIPNYFKVIRKPMDLGTMDEKLSTGQYTNAREFEKDFFQIIKNAQLFNGPGHIVTVCAERLEEIFKEEWAKKDAWMAKRAPAAASAPPVSASASRGKDEDESEEDDADTEEEAEEKPRPTTSPHLEALQQRLKEEQDKLNEQMMAKIPDINMVEVSQTMIALLQKQIIQERQKLAEAPPPKKAAKAKSAKAKKPGGGSKKATAQGAGPSGSSAAGKKSGGGTKKAPKRVMGVLEKEVITAAIQDLEGTPLERAIDIIKKDTNQNENDSGELELDIEALSQDALAKLYDISIKNFPHLRAEKERTMVAPPPPPEPAPKPKSSKPKKNKPMGKAEQEARLRQLSDLKAALKGRGSNSQEPIESIEGNGAPASAGASGAAPASESEEESSEEE